MPTSDPGPQRSGLIYNFTGGLHLLALIFVSLFLWWMVLFDLGVSSNWVSINAWVAPTTWDPHLSIFCVPFSTFSKTNDTIDFSLSKSHGLSFLFFWTGVGGGGSGETKSHGVTLDDLELAF